MKIMYLITKSNWGGAQRHVFDLAVNMLKKGHDVVVALGGSGELNDRLVAVGVRTVPISDLGRDISVGSDFASLRKVWSIVRIERPDILHVHSPKAAALGALVGRILRVKQIIYTVHGWTFNENRPIQQKVVIAFLSWVTALLCSDVILLSLRELVQAQAMPFITGRLRLVPPGIVSPDFVPLKTSLALFNSKVNTGVRSQNPIEFGHKTIIGTIAELHPNKGLIYFINAFADIAGTFPNLVAVIIGEGEERPYLESLILEKGLADRVFLIGHVGMAAQHIKAFDIFFLTSLKEGLPYVILEAGMASLPVIATAVGGIPEIIDDMKSGILIQPKKSSEIAHGIDFMLKHQPTKRGYGTALHTKVADKFSLARMLTDIEVVYSITPVQ